MATFQAIGLNLAVGSGVLAASIVAFSVAVHWEWNSEVAPRTWARPKRVIKNVLQAPLYGISWMPWALSLTYRQMLEGIPGTGTRRNGWSGKLLKCNLDDIVVIKFHALCFKVAVFATVLCLIFTLPINLTVVCDPRISGADICTNQTRLTLFESTTLANIPPMDYLKEVPLKKKKLLSGKFAKSLQRYFRVSPGITWRLFANVLVAWAIFIYTCCK